MRRLAAEWGSRVGDTQTLLQLYLRLPPAAAPEEEAEEQDGDGAAATAAAAAEAAAAEPPPLVFVRITGQGWAEAVEPELTLDRYFKPSERVYSALLKLPRAADRNDVLDYDYRIVHADGRGEFWRLQCHSSGCTCSSSCHCRWDCRGGRRCWCCEQLSASPFPCWNLADHLRSWRPQRRRRRRRSSASCCWTSTASSRPTASTSASPRGTLLGVRFTRAGLAARCRVALHSLRGGP